MPAEIISPDSVPATVRGEACATSTKFGAVVGGASGHAFHLTAEGGCALVLYAGPDDWPGLADSVNSQLSNMLSVLSTHMRAIGCDSALADAATAHAEESP